MNNTVGFILIALISLAASSVIVYWWKETKGTWVKYPAGRSMMGMLGIIALGFGYGAVNRMLGDYPARGAIGVVMYLLFIGAIIVIGFTIRKELHDGRKARRQPPAGPIKVTVAEEVTEETDDKA